MELSVVVPTLNGRDSLAACLDALAEHAPDAEVIVVNGPSADGTTGMVQDRDDVDALVEIADRGINVARNAGITRASGDTIAFLNHSLTVEDGWQAAITDTMADADVVTGPTHEKLQAGMTTESVESRRIKGRDVTYFNGDNAAISRAVLDEIDGFDEYLEVGGARDAAHRLAALDYEVVWSSDMCVRREYSTDGGVEEAEWGWKYRSLAYRLAKNYGLRPTVVRRLLAHCGSDAASGLVDVVRGGETPSSWLGNGRTVLLGIGTGLKDGTAARFRDRSPQRNPRGRSDRSDRAVTVYDWR